MSTWIGLHPHAAELIGFLPQIFDAEDPRPAREQAEDRYAHGGGWSPLPKWELSADGVIAYPGDDEPLKPVAAFVLPLSDETLFVYPHAWVCVVQADGSFEVSRMD